MAKDSVTRRAPWKWWHYCYLCFWFQIGSWNATSSSSRTTWHERWLREKGRIRFHLHNSSLPTRGLLGLRNPLSKKIVLGIRDRGQSHEKENDLVPGTTDTYQIRPACSSLGHRGLDAESLKQLGTGHSIAKTRYVNNKVWIKFSLLGIYVNLIFLCLEFIFLCITTLILGNWAGQNKSICPPKWMDCSINYNKNFVRPSVCR